jgi:large subunit ribosomal protein L10
MARLLRERIVDELTRKYAGMRHCVFVDFTGLNVELMTELRRRAHERGAEFFIVKNSLLKTAFQKVDMPARDQVFVRPTAVITGPEDPVVACSLIVEWQKKTKTARVKGGILDRRFVTSEQVFELSALPSRKVMLSRVLGVFVAPLAGFARALNGALLQVANLLQNHVEKLEHRGNQDRKD